MIKNHKKNVNENRRIPKCLPSNYYIIIILLILSFNVVYSPSKNNIVPAQVWQYVWGEECQGGGSLLGSCTQFLRKNKISK